MNFQIAATALLYTATLVTNNVREFSKVEGLVWEAVGGVGRKNTPQGGGRCISAGTIKKFDSFFYLELALQTLDLLCFAIKKFEAFVYHGVLMRDLLGCFLELALQSG